MRSRCHLEVIALARTEAETIAFGADEFSGGLPRVQGDRVQLQQVLLNLIINVIEAMRDVGEEERELLISTRNEPDGVSVEVRRFGSRPSPGDSRARFRGFLHHETERFGMGLSICCSIIEAHGGRLWASANLPRAPAFNSPAGDRKHCVVMLATRDRPIRTGNRPRFCRGSNSEATALPFCFCFAP